jgi:long-chain fatty acid transport protein
MIHKKRPLKIQVIKKLLFLTILCGPTFLNSAAFQHFQQSAASIGYNHADMAALGDEPSVAFYNPAGMTLLERGGIQCGFATSTLQSDFNGTNKLTGTNPAIFPAVIGVLGNQPYFNNLTPSNISIASASAKTAPTVGFFHVVYSHHFSCDVDVAIGFSAINPWGLETDWKCCKIWTYAGQTSFHSIALNPSLSIRYKNFYIGGGPSWQSFRFDNYNYLFGSSADFKLKDHRLSWDLGAMYQFNVQTRIGFSYRPKIGYHLKGRAQFGNFNGTGETHISVPATFTFGIYRNVTACFDLMATGVYTCWNQCKEIDVHTNIPSFTKGTVLEGFGIEEFYTFDPSHFHFPTQLKDTFFISLGGRYRIDRWQIRGGLGYDSNPIKKYREALIPDNEHYSYSLGLGYCFNNYLSFDFGYQFIFIPKAEFKAPLTSLDLSFSETLEPSGMVLSIDDFNENSTYQGSVKSFAQVISAQLRWDF